MKKRFIVAIASVGILAIAGTANAGSKYDYKSGNQYYSSGSSYQGYNYNTGSSWSGYGSSGGNLRGYDSNGNYWQYNSSSGLYYNYGTGETRYRGKKLSR